MSARPATAVVTPSLHARGGTEAIFMRELRALTAVADVTAVVPAGTGRAGLDAALGTGADHLELAPVRLPPLPGLLADEAWFRSAGLALERAARGRPIRYSPGMNALGVTHTTVHAVFAEMFEQERRHGPVLSARGAHRRWRYQRIAAWEGRLYGDPRVALATVSRRAARVLAEHYGREDVAVMRPVVDGTRFAPGERNRLRAAARTELGLADDAFVAATVGNAWLSKGTDVLIRAWLRLLPRGVDRLLVVSEEREPEVLRAAGGRPRGLRWLAGIEDIARVYAAADVLCLPSRGETFGLPVLEAALMGLPVLVSDRAGAAEIVPEAAVVATLDPLVWAERLADLAEDPDARETAGTACRRAAAAANAVDREGAFLDWLFGGGS